MLFKWFLKFGLASSRDDYSVHDYIKEKFCPEYMPAEEFDEKEQLLRDTPGPAGIKYAYFVGSKVNGLTGALAAVAATFLPIVIITALLVFAYPVLFAGGEGITMGLISGYAIGGVHAAVLGLIFAHLLKIAYFNKVNKKSLAVILPSALIFMFLPGITGGRSADFMPYFVAAIVVGGIILGVAHEKFGAWKKSRPPKYIDPYSRKAIKMRDKQLREEEWQMRQDRDDDKIKKRRAELEEQERKRKHRGEE